jgi:hypothetical protein
MRYRFHGQFTSASDAARISNLKSASKYITSEFNGRAFPGYRTPESIARTIRAEVGWETRRANEAVAAAAREKRSEAARRGWETRRESEPTKPTKPPAQVIPFPERPGPAAPAYYSEDEESDFYEGEFSGFHYKESAIGDLEDLDIQLLDECFADLDQDSPYESVHR